MEFEKVKACVAPHRHPSQMGASWRRRVGIVCAALSLTALAATHLSGSHTVSVRQGSPVEMLSGAPGRQNIDVAMGPPGSPGHPVHLGLSRPVHPVVPSAECARSFADMCRPSSPEDMLSCVQGNEEKLKVACGGMHINCELESLRTCRHATSPNDFNGCVRHNAVHINAKCEGLMFTGSLAGINHALLFLERNAVGDSSLASSHKIRTQALANRRR